jgi:hypothetical protein
MSHDSDHYTYADLDIIICIYHAMAYNVKIQLVTSTKPNCMTSFHACITVVSRSEIFVFIIVTGVTAFQKCHAN